MHAQETLSCALIVGVLLIVTALTNIDKRLPLLIVY
jgi:hypothetical protein